jgi:hypothetical protein
MAEGISIIGYEQANAFAAKSASQKIFNAANALYVSNGILKSGSKFRNWNNFRNGEESLRRKNKYGDPSFTHMWTGSHAETINNFSTGAAYQ